MILAVRKILRVGTADKLPHVANSVKCVAASTSKAQAPTSQRPFTCLRACTRWNWTSSKLIPGSCVVCARMRFLHTHRKYCSCNCYYFYLPTPMFKWYHLIAFTQGSRVRLCVFERQEVLGQEDACHIWYTAVRWVLQGRVLSDNRLYYCAGGVGHSHNRAADGACVDKS